MGNVKSIISCCNQRKKKTQFKIIISNEYELQCFVITPENEQIQIKLNREDEENNDFQPITIRFDMNEIIIGEDNYEPIEFMRNWIERSEDYDEYEIQFRNKEYHLIPEVLFALIINEYKKVVEKDFIIDQTVFDIQILTNEMFINRLKISLESIGLNGFMYNIPEFIYTEQAELLFEIIDEYNQFQKYKRILKRAQQLMSSKKKKHLLEINNNEIFTEESFENIIKQFSFQERNQLKLCELDNYCIFISSQYFTTLQDHINLIQTCKRLELNMTKYHYNPISLSNKSRQYFPNIQTLYLFSYHDCLFENDQQIIDRKIISMSFYNLTQTQINQIEKWTQLQVMTTVFDSTVDNWSEETSVFNEKINGKKQLLFLIEDEENEKFGYYLNTSIDLHYIGKNRKTDNHSFHFNLQSTNKHLKQPMKFEIKDIENGGYCLCDNNDDYLIYIGDIELFKQNRKYKSYCCQMNEYFNYQGINKALCGKKKNEYGEMCFNLKRIVVIQMG